MKPVIWIKNKIGSAMVRKELTSIVDEGLERWSKLHKDHISALQRIDQAVLATGEHLKCLVDAEAEELTPLAIKIKDVLDELERPGTVEALKRTGNALALIGEKFLEKLKEG